MIKFTIFELDKEVFFMNLVTDGTINCSFKIFTYEWLLYSIYEGKVTIEHHIRDDEKRPFIEDQKTVLHKLITTPFEEDR